MRFSPWKSLPLAPTPFFGNAVSSGGGILVVCLVIAIAGNDGMWLLLLLPHSAWQL
jgi:hypothetical protein